MLLGKSVKQAACHPLGNFPEALCLLPQLRISPAYLVEKPLSCDHSCRKYSILTIDQTSPAQIYCETSFLLSTSSVIPQTPLRKVKDVCQLSASLIYLWLTAKPALLPGVICLSGILKFRFPVNTYGGNPQLTQL